MSHKYTSIVNPNTGRKVNIHSKLGNNIIHKYIQIGGVNPWTNEKWSSYDCSGIDNKDECNDQPNNRCKWSDKGKFCRKTQSASKKRGQRNWSKLKNLSTKNISKNIKKRNEKLIEMEIVNTKKEIEHHQHMIKDLNDNLSRLKNELRQNA